MALFAFLPTSLMAGLIDYWVLTSTFALWQYVFYSKNMKKNIWPHTDMSLEKGRIF